MKNLTSHRGTLQIVKRLPSSKNGNPRYLGRIDNHEFRTKTDSSYGYSLPNLHNRFICAELGIYYGYLTLNEITGISAITK